MKKLILAIAAVFVLSGCMTRAPFTPAPGLIYQDTKAPLSLEYNRTDLGSKVGEAKTTSILGILATGDASIEAAAKNGRIKTVKHSDYAFKSILFGIYTETTVYVYGD